MAYDAFISYSHAVDGRLAPAVQRGLQHLARPWHKLRALSVFRDETGLSTNPHLWSSIERALEDSSWFVLLASPASAESPWVNREVAHWLTTKSADRILCVVTDGEWRWDGARGEFDLGPGSAVPPALADAMHDEPRHLDLRWAREDADLDLRNSRFRAAVADLAAPMHGVPKDQLESEDVRQHRRTRRLARAAVVTLATLLVLALVSAVFAFTQRDQAREQARVANAERLGAVATTVSDSRVDQALLLSLEAERLDRSVATRRALLGALTVAPALERVDHRYGTDTVSYDLDRDGGTLVVGRDHGLVQVWDLRSGHLVWQRRTRPRLRVTAVALSRDGRTVATATERGRIRLWDAARGTPRRVRFPDSRDLVTQLAFAGSDGTLVSAERYAGTVRSLSVTTGQEVEVIDAPNVARVTVSDDGARFAFVHDRGVAIVDLRSGEQSALPIDPTDHRAAKRAAFGVGDAIVVGDEGGGVTVWDASTLGVRIPRYAAHHDRVDAVASSPDGSRYATSAPGEPVRLWDAATGAAVGEPLAGHPGLLLGLWMPNRSRVVTASVGAVSSWDLHRAPLARRLRRERDAPLTWAAFPTTGDVFALFQGADGDFAVVDVARRRVDHVTSRRGVFGYDLDREHGLMALATSHEAPDTGTSGRVVVRRIASDRVVRAIDLDDLFDFPAPFASSVDISPDGETVLVGTTNNRVFRVDLASGRTSRPHRIYRGSADATIIARYTPDGRHYVVTDTSAADVALRDARSDRSVARSATLGDFVIGGFAFDVQGAEVAVTIGNDVVRLDGRTLRRAHDTLASGDSLTGEVAYSSDGRLIATPTVDGAVAVWDAASGEQLATLPVSARSVGVGFLGGRRLVTVGKDGVQVLDLGTSALRREACAIAGRNLTHREWEHFDVGSGYHATCARWPAPSDS